jgi:hypothetical protein
MMTTNPSEVHEITASISMAGASGRKGERRTLRSLVLFSGDTKGGAEDVEEPELLGPWLSNIAFPESFSDSVVPPESVFLEFPL